MSGFSIPLDRLAAKYGAKLEDVVRKSTFDLFRSVTEKSPVDTGRFRANWNVSQGAPDFTTTLSTNQGRLSAEVGKAARLPAGSVTFLSNGLPYARRLEFGWSQQAPSGMVRISVLEYRRFVERAIR